MKTIIPAILTSDINDFYEKIELVKKVCDLVQIDIMDGKFVENKSIRLDEIHEMPTRFEVHLMVDEPDKYLEKCAHLGAERVIFHYESVDDPRQLILQMQNFKFQNGMAINPNTEPEDIVELLPMLDFVLVMGVYPGYYGRSFEPSAISSIIKLKALKPELLIEVDGGLKRENVQKVAEAGADYLVVGSGIFKSVEPARSYNELKHLVN
jgi:ribulose-phosphate 3-epimerase